MIKDFLESILSECGESSWVSTAQSDGMMDTFQHSQLTQVYLRGLRLQGGRGRRRRYIHDCRMYPSALPTLAMQTITYSAIPKVLPIPHSFLVQISFTVMLCWASTPGNNIQCITAFVKQIKTLFSGRVQSYLCSLPYSRQ